MAKFLTTKGTACEIETIISEAKTQLVLISPYIQISKSFYERLNDCLETGVNVKLVYGKEDLKFNEINLLAQLEKIELYFLKELHAKCYYNEKSLVITSMNLYAFSEKTNREMGILIDKSIDKELYEKAVKEAESILRSATPQEIIGAKNTSSRNTQLNIHEDVGELTPNFGSCIRCGGQIKFNPNRPFCNKCYENWSRYGNEDFPENVCHCCGEDEETSKAEPICPHCY